MQLTASRYYFARLDPKVTAIFVLLMLSMPSTHVWANPGHTPVDEPDMTRDHRALMQARKLFTTQSRIEVDEISRRYTVVYTGPDRYYHELGFGLYPQHGAPLARSVLSGWFYRGREYPVTFECRKLEQNPDSFRMIMDRVRE
ncbi:MAG: hypothetical protein OEZ10_13040 [Gammaproteobacteria bacterium]|nr:hypothetical protein [Gammaproteobacteria bacterium]